jgi:hypothetical protein
MKRNKKGQFVSPLRPFLIIGVIGMTFIMTYGIAVRADRIFISTVEVPVSVDEKEIIFNHYVQKLLDCESSNDPTAINEDEPNGWNSRGVAQWQYPSVMHYLKKYDLLDPEWEQEDIINLMHTREFSVWLLSEVWKREGHAKDWSICAKKLDINNYLKNYGNF